MTLVEKLTARIDDIDAKKAEVQARATTEIAELNGMRAQLVQMRAALQANPALEQLFNQAKALGIA